MQALLEALAGGVSEGHLAFAELAGMHALSVTQQASRCDGQARWRTPCRARALNAHTHTRGARAHAHELLQPADLICAGVCREDLPQLLVGNKQPFSTASVGPASHGVWPIRVCSDSTWLTVQLAFTHTSCYTACMHACMQGCQSFHVYACRYLAHVALARGDRPGARARLEALVGRELMGRSAERAEAWAHAELGAVLAADGQLEVSRLTGGRERGGGRGGTALCRYCMRYLLLLGPGSLGSLTGPFTVSYKGIGSRHRW